MHTWLFNLTCLTLAFTALFPLRGIIPSSMTEAVRLSTCDYDYEVLCATIKRGPLSNCGNSTMRKMVLKECKRNVCGALVGRNQWKEACNAQRMLKLLSMCYEPLQPPCDDKYLGKTDPLTM